MEEMEENFMGNCEQYTQMSYSDFYDIAEYGNANWKGKFTPKEIAENAYRYYADFLWSVENKTVSETIKTLCKNLAEDAREMPDSEEPKRWLNQMAEALGLDDII